MGVILAQVVEPALVHDENPTSDDGSPAESGGTESLTTLTVTHTLIRRDLLRDRSHKLSNSQIGYTFSAPSRLESFYEPEDDVMMKISGSAEKIVILQFKSPKLELQWFPWQQIKSK